uniref:CUB domain-containing protein n=1 Tax=Bactrocera latifrons TaxID=174628 RepID=A0A0K8VDH5_BACLA
MTIFSRGRNQSAKWLTDSVAERNHNNVGCVHFVLSVTAVQTREFSIVQPAKQTDTQKYIRFEVICILIAAASMKSENAHARPVLSANARNARCVSRTVSDKHTINWTLFTKRCLLALQTLLRLACTLLALNSCYTHTPALFVQAAPSLAWHNSDLRTNGTHSIDRAWPPNLQHIDIWSAIGQSSSAAELAADEEPEVQSWHVIEDFQYDGTDLAAPHEYTSGGLNGTQVQQKVSKRPKRVRDAIEKHLESKDTLDPPNSRQNRVIHLLPVPVDDECLSDDGRRIGNCFNIYECRAKGGIAKGDCAMGFGVCCIFIASCNTTISNNITYLVSPQFPSFMPSNYSAPCSYKIKLMSNEVSQLRIDFYHFSMGQPNRRTGVCDGDVFAVNGGPSGALTLCGQNSGQHIYYEVGGAAAPRQTLFGNLRPLSFNQLYPNSSDGATPTIEIVMNFTQRFQPIRLWEIRIAQIPFSQRAPVGCLQYHTGTEGIIQTFNFAENGRHLANQNYRICMRQEQYMCSIMYQPCDEQSFRIGPGSAAEPGMLNMGAPALMMDPTLAGMMGGGGGATGAVSNDDPTLDAMPIMQSTVLADDPNMLQMMDATTIAAMMSSAASADAATTTTAAVMDASTAATDSSAATMSTEAASSSAAPSSSTGVTSASDMPATSTEALASSSSATTLDTRSSTTPATTSSTTLSDEIADEGSGGGDTDPVAGAPTRRPRPVRGGFDLLGFLRSAFDFRTFRRSSRQLVEKSANNGGSERPAKSARQLYSRCTDRLTMPCIIEDFIGMGPLGSPTLPGCEPVHCGTQFCSSGTWPCRIESTVTPFYIGVHFGSGSGKGSAEDNIGACLRYQQVECM